MTIPVAIIVQARAGGSRFPGKVLASILGQPMLLWQLDRLSQMPSHLPIVVATPDTPENKAIAELCWAHGYECLSLPCREEDVLKRYLLVAEEMQTLHIIRITADCPLIDPLVVEQLWQRYQGAYPRQYLGINERQWPDGQDCEVFSAADLAMAAHEAAQPSDREHVTPFMKARSMQRMPCPFQYPNMQYSVDTTEDAEAVEYILRLAIRRGIVPLGYREIGMLIYDEPALQVWQYQRKGRNHKYHAQVQQEHERL